MVVAMVGIERELLLERLRVWRLGNWCGALNKGLMFSSLVVDRFKVTKCWKIGCDKIPASLGNLPMGVLERLRWVREEEKGRWTKLQNDSSLIPKWLERSRRVMLWMISTMPRSDS